MHGLGDIRECMQGCKQTYDKGVKHGRVDCGRDAIRKKWDHLSAGFCRHTGGYIDR